MIERLQLCIMLNKQFSLPKMYTNKDIHIMKFQALVSEEPHDTILDPNQGGDTSAPVQ